MVRKDRVVPESAEGPLDYTFRSVGGKLVVTSKDRICFDACIDMTGLEAHRGRIAYFEIDTDGITAHGRKLPYNNVPWAEAKD